MHFKMNTRDKRDVMVRKEKGDRSGSNFSVKKIAMKLPEKE